MPPNLQRSPTSPVPNFTQFPLILIHIYIHIRIYPKCISRQQRKKKEREREKKGETRERRVESTRRQFSLGRGKIKGREIGVK